MAGTPIPLSWSNTNSGNPVELWPETINIGTYDTAGRVNTAAFDLHGIHNISFSLILLSGFADARVVVRHLRAAEDLIIYDQPISPSGVTVVNVDLDFGYQQLNNAYATGVYVGVSRLETAPPSSASLTISEPIILDTAAVVVDPPPDPPIVIPLVLNCDCISSYNSDTMGNMVQRMMVRLGYAASAANPPPGMTALLKDFLAESQRFLFDKVASFRDSRYFSWDLEQGVRHYGYGTSDEPCGLPFIPDHVEGVWTTDGNVGNERWNKLICGIDPYLYSGGDRQSYPQRYELRQCVELWPAPDDRVGKLVIKAKAGLGPFEDDADTTSIDSDIVFLLALANAKAHYNKPDAQTYGGMVQSRISDLIAAAHHTRRYIPGGGDPYMPPEPYMIGGWIE